MQDTRIIATVVNGRIADLEHLIAPLLADPAGHFQELLQIIDLLSWHNRLPQLNEIYHAAWPAIRSAPHLRPPARNRFSSSAADALIYAYLEVKQPLQLESAVAELQPQLSHYYDTDAAALARYLAYLAGMTQQLWAPADFDFSHTNETTAGKAAANLGALMIEFVSSARIEMGIPFGRSSLMRGQLPLYLSMRRTGQLVVRQPIADLMQGKRPFLDLDREEPPHPLCPDSTTLNRYFANLLHFARPQPYKAAALYALLPTWLRFLASRGLIDEAQQAVAFADLKRPLAELETQWSDHPDPTLLDALHTEWNKE